MGNARVPKRVNGRNSWSAASLARPTGRDLHGARHADPAQNRRGHTIEQSTSISRRVFRPTGFAPIRPFAVSLPFCICYLLWRVGSRFRFLRSGGVSKIKRQPDQGDAGSHTQDIQGTLSSDLESVFEGFYNQNDENHFTEP
jgi:hypothetical protein